MIALHDKVTGQFIIDNANITRATNKKRIIELILGCVNNRVTARPFGAPHSELSEESLLFYAD